MFSTTRRLVGLDGQTVADLVRAGWELGLARVRLKSPHTQALIAAPPVKPQTLNGHQAALASRVAYAIPRVAARLPWRADCMVQALAAGHWLARQGIATTLTFGVPRDKRARFEAHVWLTAGTQLVTGGDISGYVPLARS